MNVNNLPLVSVVIPTYKGFLSLNKAIESVLRQTYKNIEIIVVDDNNPNSEDRLNTENVMRLYDSDERIIYLKHPTNMNGSAARNTGIRHSKGKYISFLDDDDEYFPMKIEYQVNCLENKDESWGICYTAYVYEKNGKIFNRSFENREGNLFLDALMRNLFIAAGSNLFMRKIVVEDVGYFDETFERNQDLEYLVRILKKYKIAYSNVLGLIVHMHKPKNPIDYVSVTKLYCETFSGLINELSLEDRHKFDKMINLQLFRYLLSHNIISALQLIFCKGLSVKDIVLYYTHLFYRFIAKKSLGYRL